LSASQQLIELIRTFNPYYYLGPVPKKEFFFDREEELATAFVVIKQILKDSIGGILVQGGRGSGKTSFLKELQRRLDDKNIANAYIPLDPEMVQEGSETRLFSTIIQELIRSSYSSKILDKNIAFQFVDFLRKISKIDNIEIDFPGFNLILKPEAAQEQFSYIVLRDGLCDFLKLIETKGKKGAILGAVVLLDEGDALSLNAKLLHVLRNAFQEIRNIVLVIAGSTKLST
jgi:Cdc6-like AAA superfamily ATPase